MANEKILIIDDDPRILDLSALILKAEGYQVIQSANGADALKKIQQASPDLLIVDLMLPDINGGEIVKVAREKFACKAPVIFLTGMITKEEEGQKSTITIKDKNYTTLAKPFDQAKFLELVNSKLAR